MQHYVHKSQLNVSFFQRPWFRPVLEYKAWLSSAVGSNINNNKRGTINNKCTTVLVCLNYFFAKKNQESRWFQRKFEITQVKRTSPFGNLFLEELAQIFGDQSFSSHVLMAYHDEIFLIPVIAYR